MKIAFIGTGTVSKKLALPWSEAGHQIVFGSRNPGAGEAPYPIFNQADAVADADVIVNAVPGNVSLETFRAIGDAALAGKVIIDLANAMGNDRGLLYPNSSLGKALQDALPSARVVKSMNTAYIGLIAKPGAYEDPGSLFLSGNDEGAKDVVRGLLDDLGWPPDRIIDLGGIETAQGAEHYFVLFRTLLGAMGGSRFNIRVVGT